MANNDSLQFRFSLTILNHLGPGLYRSFATTIAEAIANAWDAGAKCVNIQIKGDTLTIWDDGIGMSREDIEEKFLNIGYARRENFNYGEIEGRHVLGRKGVGKLAYLSISDELVIITKKKGGGTIPMRVDNSKLRKAISEKKEEYILDSKKADIRDSRILESGTQLIFRKLERNLISEDIRQILAMQFDFTHALRENDKFQIRVNNKPIGIKDLKGLYENTEFIWFLNEASEKEFMAQMHGINKKFAPPKNLNVSFFHEGNKKEIRGYIASVHKPSQLTVTRPDFDETIKASIALFAGGRIRESEIISKVTTAQMPESYLFGQIHIDEMDSEDVDRFTTGRDGIIGHDLLYQSFLDFMKKDVLLQVKREWREGRKEKKNSLGKKEKNPLSINKKVAALVEALIGENIDLSENRPLVREIIKLADINVPSYIKCFVAENIMRIYIREKKMAKTKDSKKKISDRKIAEEKAKKEGNVTINIRRKSPDEEYNDLGYLDSLDMVAMIHKGDDGDKSDSLRQDAKKQRPIRNALMHTATLSEDAKEEGKSSWNNIINKITKILEE